MTMRITESQLRRIVRQEVLREMEEPPGAPATYRTRGGAMAPVRAVPADDWTRRNALFDTPKAAMDALFTHQGGPESWTVYQDTQTGRFFARGRYDTYGT